MSRQKVLFEKRVQDLLFVETRAVISGKFCTETSEHPLWLLSSTCVDSCLAMISPWAAVGCIYTYIYIYIHIYIYILI